MYTCAKDCRAKVALEFNKVWSLPQSWIRMKGNSQPEVLNLDEESNESHDDAVKSEYS